MAILNDSLEIRLASHDYQQDWGVVGDPVYAVLTKYRSQADMLELCVAHDDPVRALLMTEGCSVQVKYRGRVEFLGHVNLRQGGVSEDAPVTVFARDETEVFDHTLAWVMPSPKRFTGSWGGLHSSGNIEPLDRFDTGQAFPDPFLDPGHYMWTLPFQDATDPTLWNSSPPYRAGDFIGSFLNRNIERIGYSRGTLFSGNTSIHPGTTGVLHDFYRGAPQRVLAETAWSDWYSQGPFEAVPWPATFSGISPRFQTLREVVNVFQKWVDENYDASFNLFCDGQIGVGSFGIRVGYRATEGKYPVPLTVAGGTVVDGSWSISDHSASRVVLGGPGEQEQRIFQERRMPSREASGRVIEVFKDATGAKLTSANQAEYTDYPRYYFVDPSVPDAAKQRTRAYFDQRAERYLAEASPETSVEFTLRETSEVYYGGEGGYQIGQMVTIDLGWAEFEKRIERVTLSFTRTEGLSVTPLVGSEVSGNDEVQARALRALASAQRRNQSER